MINSLNNDMSITGKWINKRTGDIVNVRDSIIDGNNMIVLTDRGNISMDAFSRDYIQAQDGEYDIKGNKISDTPMEMESLAEAFKNNSEKNFSKMVTGIDDSGPDSTVSKPVQKQPETKQSQPEQLIEKVFKGTDTNLAVNVDITGEVPDEELNFLKKFFSVTDYDIADYIYKHFTTPAEIKSAITDFLNRKS